MPIDRYLLWGNGEPFGECTEQDSPLYRLYFRDGRVGLFTRILKGEPAGFTYGFLTWGDTLFVRRHGQASKLWRDCYPQGVLSEKKGAGHAVGDLADLLQHHEGIHVFESCPPGSTVPNVLTFSAEPPVGSNYRKVRPMRVVVE